jgi:spore photoproduct lyase
MRNSIVKTGQELLGFMENMVPMFPPKVFPGSSKPKSGKFSFTDDKRVEIFQFAIDEIRKYSDCPVALCKESASVWDMLDMDLRKCQCVCQLDYANMMETPN